MTPVGTGICRNLCNSGMDLDAKDLLFSGPGFHPVRQMLCVEASCRVCLTLVTAWAVSLDEQSSVRASESLLHL